MRSLSVMRGALLATIAAVGVLLVLPAGAAWLGQREAPPLPEPVELEGGRGSTRPKDRRGQPPEAARPAELAPATAGRNSARSRPPASPHPPQPRTADAVQTSPPPAPPQGSVTTLPSVGTSDDDASDDDGDEAAGDD